MGLEMVDSDEGLPRRQRHALARHQSHQNAANQARSRRGRNPLEVPRLHSGAIERPDNQRIDDLDMGARRDLRHHPAEGRVRRDLAHHFVSQNLARPVGLEPHHRRGRLVARRLDAQNPHTLDSLRWKTRP